MRVAIKTDQDILEAMMIEGSALEALAFEIYAAEIDPDSKFRDRLVDLIERGEQLDREADELFADMQKELG